VCCGKGRLSTLFAFDLSTVMLPCSCINCEIWVAYVTLYLVSCNWIEDCSLSHSFQVSFLITGLVQDMEIPSYLVFVIHLWFLFYFNLNPFICQLQ